MIIIDIRDPLLFAAGHLKGAVNIPYGPNFSLWLSQMGEKKPVFLTVGDVIPEIEGIVGYRQFEKTDEAQETLALLTPKQLKENKHTVIDVRTPSEWATGYIEGAHLIELSQLPHVYKKIPAEKPLAIICGSGYRSSVAASWLKYKGISSVASVWGGMQSVKKESI